MSLEWHRSVIFNFFFSDYLLLTKAKTKLNQSKSHWFAQERTKINWCVRKCSWYSALQQVSQSEVLADSHISWCFIISFGFIWNSRLTELWIDQNRKKILLNLHLSTNGSALRLWEALWTAALMRNGKENIRLKLNDREWNPFIKPTSAVIAWTYSVIIPTDTRWNPEDAFHLEKVCFIM